MQVSELEQMRDALRYLDPGCDRETWHTIGRAVIDVGGTADEVVDWSRPAPNFKSEQDVRAAFKTIKPGGGTTVKTIFKLAREAGWPGVPDPRDEPNRPATTARERKPLPHPTAAWNNCFPAKPDHPAIVAKDGVAEGLRAAPADSKLRIAGQSVAGWLAVPICELDGSFKSLQFIPPPGAGKKLNYPAPMGAGMFIIGEIASDAVIYVTEGYGQASATWKATGKPSAMAFGWGRVRAVAAALKQRYPAASLVIVPDTGKEDDAEKIAGEIGCQWVDMPPGWPQNSDVNDLAQRDGYDVLEALLATPKSPPQPAAPFALVPIGDLGRITPEAPQFVWDGMAPMREVTLLTAHGGGVKTTAMLMLAVAASAGMPLFGIATWPAKVAFYSAEDGAGRMRYLLHGICKSMSVDADALKDRLFLLDATEGAPVLFAEITAAGRREGTTTATYSALREFVKTHEIGLLIIDNASDVFDANEIERAKVRGFMRSLANLARECNLAVVLIAHVDKGTSRGERAGSESYSGSTAWHNSARSRLFMSRDKDGLLVIEQQKNNLGALHEPIRLVWPKGGFPQLDVPLGPVVQGIADRGHERAILRLINEFTARGEYVSAATTSRTHAGNLLGKEPTFPKGLKNQEVFDILRRAERAGHLERLTIKGANRHERECWQTTAAGAAFAGINSANLQKVVYLSHGSALTALTPEVGALDAVGADGCADCADFGAGGMGGMARAQESAQ